MDRVRSTTLRVAFTSLVLCVPAGAQRTAGVHEGPVERFRLDAATGEVVSLDPAARASVPAAYDNASCVNGRFVMIPSGEEWMDFGFKATGLSGVITEFTFAYATTAIDPSIEAVASALPSGENATAVRPG